MPDSDEILRNCIEAIWDKYDADQSGYLDKEQCFVFMLESVSDLMHHDGDLDRQSDEPLTDEENREFWKPQFEVLFRKVDIDGSGTICKNEMLLFIKQLIEI